jgi:hypothetical protein
MRKRHVSDVAPNTGYEMDDPGCSSSNFHPAFQLVRELGFGFLLGLILFDVFFLVNPVM